MPPASLDRLPAAAFNKTGRSSPLQAAAVAAAAAAAAEDEAWEPGPETGHGVLSGDEDDYSEGEEGPPEVQKEAGHGALECSTQTSFLFIFPDIHFLPLQIEVTPFVLMRPGGRKPLNLNSEVGEGTGTDPLRQALAVNAAEAASANAAIAAATAAAKKDAGKGISAMETLDLGASDAGGAVAADAAALAGSQLPDPDPSQSLSVPGPAGLLGQGAKKRARR